LARSGKKKRRRPFNIGNGKRKREGYGELLLSAGGKWEMKKINQKGKVEICAEGGKRRKKKRTRPSHIIERKKRGGEIEDATSSEPWGGGGEKVRGGINLVDS